MAKHSLTMIIKKTKNNWINSHYLSRFIEA